MDYGNGSQYTFGVNTQSLVFNKKNALTNKKSVDNHPQTWYNPTMIGKEPTMYTLTAYQNDKLRFVWGLDSKDHAIVEAMKFLRRTQRFTQGFAEITRGADIVWARGDNSTG
jgi:hypothetical protein